MERVLVIGGTGLIGQDLCKKLREKGYDVSVLSRSTMHDSKYPSYIYNINENYIDSEAIENTDFIINLAGAGIAEKRWTANRKQLIIDSRIKTTEFIFEKIKKENKNLKAYISTSAIGYYGAVTSEKIFSENETPANDFIGNVCSQWEYSADKFNSLGIRTVKIRVGIVLSNQGGALTKMLPPIKMGLGSAIGNGKQYMPWIHIDDLTNIYIKALEDTKMNGAYNAVAPDHQTNKEFSKTLATVLHKPFFFPNIPSFLIKLLFGQMSKIVLNGSKVSSEKIQSSNFTFHYPTLERALKNLFLSPK